ncbi:dTDP-4-dehydrorhamnose 3,5-epimerase [Sphingosinithalassobacter sp. LHW66-3]|uniref:dTDP-4-dehydrorhamnose 3,5-epimerase n=1 Tax=Sphingosinithalassobacter sp. LHW66-3 TaxID=3424718 RepID=UPI003D6A88D1
MTTFRSLAIPEVIEVVPNRFGDERGFFSETYNAATFARGGVECTWVQDNHSLSAEPGTVRGLHLQAPPAAQDKLIRVVRGAIFDVAVDVRAGSPTYGQWVGVELSSEQWNQLFVPKGFAHGFMTITPDAEVLYKVSALYSPEHEMAIRWDDPDIGIEWPRPLSSLSGKDAVASAFRKHQPVFRYQG